jgi:DNA-binding NtrC family response regulator
MDIQNYPEKPVLLIDDEQDILQSYRRTLKFNKISNLLLCSDSREVQTILEHTPCSAIILDLFMPHVTGQQILVETKNRYPDIPVIVVTGSNQVATAVDCMKNGAYDYIVKPVDDSRLIASLRNALEMNALHEENRLLRERILETGLKKPQLFSAIITISESMKSIFSYIEAIAASSRPVLITGESGTGKELLARALHDSSGRTGKFVAVNVGGLDDTVFSDTLFGHRKGAFTGADAERSGLIEQASGGTLFLDEIGTLDKGSQVKLLRLLQEREYYQLGSDTHKISNVVIVAATNEDLLARMRDGTFRSDLYFRLMTHTIRIPPLRERSEDIPVLIDFFITEACQSMGKVKPALDGDVVPLLTGYSFPGNVRELQALIFDTVGRARDSKISIDYFIDHIRRHSGGTIPAPVKIAESRYFQYFGEIPKLKDVEEFLINEAMKKAKGNQSAAAQILGVSQSGLSRRFSKENVAD